MLRRLLVIAALGLGGLLLTAPSYAASGLAPAEPAPPNWCFQPKADGEMPSCEWDGTRWHRTYDGTTMDGLGVGGGLPAWFVLLAVLAVLGGIAGTVYKVSLARRMAERSGMSKGEATAVTLLGDDGLDAAYVASSLRRPEPVTPPATPTSSPAPRTAEERLRELQQLLDQGLVTQEEYDARRRVVLDGI